MAASVSDAVVDDFDGDGLVDIIIVSNRGLVRYEYKAGSGTFSSEVIAADQEHRGLATGDLDGDGDLDLMARTDDRSEWFENDSTGRFSPPVMFADPVWGQFVDLDDDGDTDIVTSGRYADVIWHENVDGRGGFGTARLVARNGTYYSSTILHPADIDGDGDLDIASASYHADLSWYENTAFGPQHLIELAYEVYSDLLSGDVDGDGDLDLVAVIGDFSQPSSIVWYENTDGGGTFGPRAEILFSDTVLAASINDIDGDGKLDIVVARCDGITWYEQRIPGDANGDGRFDSKDLIEAFAQGKYQDDAEDNATFGEGDWDGDGDFTADDMVYAFQAGHYVAAT